MQAPVPRSIGRYEILELVGKGGMGVLYRAIDPTLERDVALKMMHVDFTSDQVARDRFQREARAVARLQHKNVVTIHELGEVDGTPYIVMEFLTGKDLDQILRSKRPLSLVEKIEIAIQLCHGLGYAHEQGIVHRDIKPGNVRVLEDGTVKLLDFGIAKFAMSSMTQTGTVMGTPSYMAPEQISGSQVDGRADLFSVGVLLYELLAGHKPFTGDSPTAIVYQIMHVEAPPIRKEIPDLPEALNAIVDRALQKNPNDRYARAAELAADLQMVKVSLDPPLKTGDSLYTGSGSAGLTLGKLHATQLRNQTSLTQVAALDGPMRATAAAAAADAAARATPSQPWKRPSPMVLALGALAVAVVGFGIYLAVAGGPDNAADTATTPPATGAAGTPTTGTPGTRAGGTPAPQSPGTPSGPATVHIVTVPAGAQIVVNGTDLGRVSPADVVVDRRGPASVQVASRGFVTATVTLGEADFKAGRREIRLAKDAGPVKVRITAPFPIELVQGGRVISPSATEHDLTVQPNGPVVARNSEFLLNTTLAVDFRGPFTHAVQSLGSISVFTAIETCRITIDDLDLGPQPIVRKRLAAGPHTVQSKCPGGQDETKRVTIVSGELQQVSFERR